jgi:hypothetical protein
MEDVLPPPEFRMNMSTGIHVVDDYPSVKVLFDEHVDHPATRLGVLGAPS